MKISALILGKIPKNFVQILEKFSRSLANFWQILQIRGKARFPLDVHMQEDSPVSLVFGRCRPDDKGAEVLKGAFCKASASCSWLLSSKKGSGPAGTPEVE